MSLSQGFGDLHIDHSIVIQIFFISSSSNFIFTFPNFSQTEEDLYDITYDIISFGYNKTAEHIIQLTSQPPFF